MSCTELLRYHCCNFQGLTMKEIQGGQLTQTEAFELMNRQSKNVREKRERAERKKLGIPEPRELTREELRASEAQKQKDAIAQRERGLQGTREGKHHFIDKVSGAGYYLQKDGQVKVVGKNVPGQGQSVTYQQPSAIKLFH